MSGVPRSAARSAASAAGARSSQPHSSCRRAIAAGSVSGAERRCASSRAPGAVIVRDTAETSDGPSASRARRMSRLARVAASIARWRASPSGTGGDRRGSRPACVART